MAKKRKSPTAAALRKQLSKLDEQLVRLLVDRGDVARELNARTEQAGVDFAAEDRLVDWAEQQVNGELDGPSVRSVFREVISATRGSKPARVAFLGPQYSYSHLATLERFGNSAELNPVASIAAIFEEVHLGQAEFGVAPIENSTDGRIVDTLEMFAKHPLRICGEVQSRIHHCLLGRCPRGEVRVVASKPQALSQCRNWLATHLPNARLEPMSSTASAAQRAVAEAGVAAIASRHAGAHHGLDLLAENVEDNRDNITRFAIIGRQKTQSTGNDKSALMFELPHQSGALADAMAIFKRNGLNLTWIESFPISGSPNEYLFFVELEGHENDAPVQSAVRSLGRKTVRLDLLGSYQKSPPSE
ncbi:MAG: prephenate dehydratase [Pirellulaceae bacterium]|jgi:chorismate mutase/prephenate dehydratase|nr:prephenate dehydratase [Pirellulaceae bacterium]MDP7017432.1 prephenate dehydratase [Pirellulaceae bacterium]